LFGVVYEDYVGSRPVQVRAWSDLVLYEDIGSAGGRDRWGYAFLVSLAGPDSAVKALSAALCECRRISAFQGSGADLRRLLLHSRSRGAWRVFSSRVGDVAHAVCVHESCFSWMEDWRGRYRVLVAWDDDLEGALWAFLRAESPVPVLREWVPEIARLARSRGWLQRLDSWGRDGVSAWLMYDNLPSALGKLVSREVQRGSFAFPGGSGPASPTLSGLKGLDEYLKMYGPALGRQVVRAYRPLYDPASEEPDRRVWGLLRRPYRAQADAVEGLVRLLRERRSGLVVGECGVGKTLVAAAVPYLLWEGRPYRVLVMCPNHLVRKWKREVEETVPGAQVVVLSGWRDVLALRDVSGRPSCPEYYVLARDTAKLGFFWKPAALWREGTAKGKRKGWHCPDCGDLLVDKDGVPFPKGEFSERRKRNLKCARCGALLWQADASRVRKVAPAELVKRYLARRRFFDFFVMDEVHEGAPRGAVG